MDQKSAAALSKLLLEHGRQLDQFLIDIQDRTTEGDFKEARTVVGKVMGVAYLDGLHPIFLQYPELKPAGLD